MSETTAPPEAPIEQIAPPIEPPAVETTPTEPVSEEPKVYDQAYVDKLRKESAGYRTKLREVEPIVAKHQEAEEATKTEIQRATERAEALAQQNTQLIVEAVAAKHGISEEDYDLLGSGTREELESRAARLAARSTPVVPNDPPSPPSNRPVETLRPGASPQPPQAEDNSYPAAWRPAARERS